MNKHPLPVSELFRNSWQEYKERALTILAVMLITTALLSFLVLAIILPVVIGVPLLTHLVSERTAILLIMAVVGLASLFFIILAVWSQTALLAVIVDKKLGIIEAFQRGRDYLWPMTWVLTIFSGIVMTGFVLGFLPGVLFLVWFAFCFFILLENGHSPMDTLLLSREYVRGYWWNTFGKLLLVWFLAGVIGIIPFIGQALSLLATPFCLLFALNVYRDLKEIKGTLQIPADSTSRIFWWIVAGIGLILPILALVGGLIALFTSDPQWLETMPGAMGGLRI